MDININETKFVSIIKEIESNFENKYIPNSYYIEDNNLIIIKGKEGLKIDENVLEQKLHEELATISSEKNFIEIPIKHMLLENINIDEIYEEICKEPQNAYYKKNPLQIFPEVIGVSFDKNDAKNILKEDKNEYEIALSFIKPQITLEELDINIFQEKLSTFSTKYNVSNTDRVTNLELASSKIDSYILPSGEEFSYNKIVGARTIDAGYKEAKIYSNGTVVDGVGGGICQLSSTLYNAVLLANLDVTERHNHQFLTSYISAGRDATVSYGFKDFKFKNSRSYPIKIETIIENGNVICSIYGINEEKEFDVDIEVNVLSVEDPPIKYEKDEKLPYGAQKILQRGTKSESVEVYKVLYDNGKVVSKNCISKDYYHALEQIVAHNSTNE